MVWERTGVLHVVCDRGTPGARVAGQAPWAAYGRFLPRRAGGSPALLSPWLFVRPSWVYIGKAALFGWLEEMRKLVLNWGKVLSLSEAVTLG